MVKWSREPTNPSKACKAMGVDLPTSFKNTYQVAQAIKHMDLRKAQTYLEDVLERKQCIPYRRLSGGTGRCAQAKAFKGGVSNGRWPVKSVRVILDLLKNAESNSEFKNLDPDNMYISHIAVNRAQHGRRRTYRAHGRINAYMSSPCHVEVFLQEHKEDTEKSDEPSKTVRFTKKQMARFSLRSGNGKAPMSHKNANF